MVWELVLGAECAPKCDSWRSFASFLSNRYSSLHLVNLWISNPPKPGFPHKKTISLSKFTKRFDDSTNPGEDSQNQVSLVLEHAFKKV